jgi:hypothetical protein
MCVWFGVKASQASVDVHMSVCFIQQEICKVSIAKQQVCDSSNNELFNITPKQSWVSQPVLILDVLKNEAPKQSWNSDEVLSKGEEYVMRALHITMEISVAS